MDHGGSKGPRVRIEISVIDLASITDWFRNLYADPSHPLGVSLSLGALTAGLAGGGVLAGGRWGQGLLLAAVVLALGLVTVVYRSLGFHTREHEDIRVHRAVDRLVAEREDAGYHRELRTILTRVHEKWSSGAFENVRSRVEVQERALDSVLELVRQRLKRVVASEPSILVAREEAECFVVRRVSGPLRERYHRGHKCARDVSLQETLARLGPHTYPAHFDACGARYELVVVCETPLPKTAEAEAELAAFAYEAVYEHIRLMELSHPPPRKSLVGAV